MECGTGSARFCRLFGKKWCQRYMFLKDLRMARITVTELDQLLQRGNPPTIIDVCIDFAQQQGKISVRWYCRMSTSLR